MDIGARYGQLCSELGNLDLEIKQRVERRTAILGELEVLQRLAVLIQRNGVSHVPMGERPSETPATSTPVPNGRTYGPHQEGSEAV